MENFEKKEYLNRLFDIYKELLTDKQVKSFTYYYIDDYSLQEIAELLEVSRNAIFDQLKNVEQHLNAYEEKLQLYKKQEAREELLKQLEKNADKTLIEAIRKLDE